MPTYHVAAFALNGQSEAGVVWMDRVEAASLRDALLLACTHRGEQLLESVIIGSSRMLAACTESNLSVFASVRPLEERNRGPSNGLPRES